MCLTSPATEASLHWAVIPATRRRSFQVFLPIFASERTDSLSRCLSNFDLLLFFVPYPSDQPRLVSVDRPDVSHYRRLLFSGRQARVYHSSLCCRERKKVTICQRCGSGR